MRLFAASSRNRFVGFGYRVPDAGFLISGVRFESPSFPLCQKEMREIFPGFQVHVLPRENRDSRSETVTFLTFALWETEG
jgi:hypothetical protein